MKKIFLIIFILILCSCAPKIAEPSIFDNQLCGDLCWNGIQVGKTTKQELLELIPAIQNLDENSVSIHKYSHPESVFDTRITFKFYRVANNQKSEVSVIAEIIDDIIVTISFSGDLGLTFEEVINELSEPRIVTSNYVFDGGYNTHFLNDVSGYSITSYFKNDRSSVSSETKIYDIELFFPELYSVISNDYLIPDESSKIYNWNGYGKIGDLYWPPR